jgi:hypothetical protein
VNNPPNDPNQPNGKSPDDGLHHQNVQMGGVTARVPESVSSGLFSTGAIVMMGQHSFVLDFVQQFGKPPQLVARIVLPQAVLGQLVGALEQNLTMFTKNFGEPPTLPKNPNQPKPSVQDIYNNMKLSDEVHSGTFAEAVMIRHSPADFCFDFITRFFPQATVSSRVFVSAPNIPPLLKALQANLKKLQDGKPDANDPSNPPEDIS